MAGKKKKMVWIVFGVILGIIFIGLCYWKRIGIRNTFYRAVGIQVPVNDTYEKTAYGFYKQVADVDTDLDLTVLVGENDGAADTIDTSIGAEDTLVRTTYDIDQQIEAELTLGNYSLENPMVVLNPYKISPLTGLVLFQTEENCRVRVTVKGKTKEADISGELPAATSHRVPLAGLYPNMENMVILELLDTDGNVTETRELKVQTSGLPESLHGMVKPVKTSGESAFGLTMVYGQKCLLPFAYDSAGDIRWYLEKETGNYGLYHLSNGRILFQDTGGYAPSQQKPQTTNIYEMDYLGRTYNLYYLPNGSHHEIIEKEPGGNLLALTSSLKGHFEDEIIEIDRETGEIVNELELEDVFGETYVDKMDWAHINTVSYQKEDDTILISSRNLHSGIKINWTTHELVWILCAPEFWEGTEFEDYVLQPVGDFNWHYQQHTVYQLDADLDQNQDTVEISLFDNHWITSRKVDYFDELPDSYLTTYAVNEEEMTVTQLKMLSVTKSKITSNTIYDKESGHIFGMCGWIVEAQNNRRGMAYEFDYETGEVVNQYSIKGKFYRAAEMKLNFEDLSAPMEIDENYIKGCLKPAVEITEEVETPKKKLKDGVSFKLVGSVLYLNTLDHRVSQLIFKGGSRTYVYDTTAIKQSAEDYLLFQGDIPIPLQNLEPDTYEILVVYENRFCDTGKSFSKLR